MPGLFSLTFDFGVPFEGDSLEFLLAFNWKIAEWDMSIVRNWKSGSAVA
jgi:hypothetical protein